MADSLSRKDVERLLSDPSAEARSEAATKVAEKFVDGSLSDSEREIAEGIFRALVRDTEVRVREALSASLRESGLVPPDIASTLARDVDSVSLPVLEFSAALTEEDLIDIVRTQGEAQQVAVARRQEVGESLADALVETENRDVVATLAANEGADISEKTFDRVIDRFGGDDKVGSALVHRQKLPVRTAERLVTVISDNLLQHLATSHELPPGMAATIVQQSRERATIGLLAGSPDDESAATLARHLQKNCRLTPSIVLRGVCTGDLAFFEHAVALLAGVSVQNARILIHDSGGMGLARLWSKAGLPDGMLQVIRIALDVGKEVEFDGGEHDRERHAARTIEMVLTNFDDFEADSLEFLLNRLGKLNEAAAA